MDITTFMIAVYCLIDDFLSDGKSTSPFAALRAMYNSPTYQAIFDEAEAILKLPRHISMHPGGVVVAPGALTDLVPVMRSGGKGQIITQLDWIRWKP